MSNLRVTSPAMLHEVMDLYAACTPMKPINVKVVILQHARSESDAYFIGDRLIAAAMYYPLPAERPGERLLELAFVCLPELAQHLVAFIHSSQSTRARLAETGPVRVRAHVRSDHRPGRRLAALCGMRMVGTFGAFDRWEFEGAPDVEIRAGHSIAVLRDR